MNLNYSFCGFLVAKANFGQWCNEGGKKSHAPILFFAQGCHAVVGRPCQSPCRNSTNPWKLCCDTYVTFFSTTSHVQPLITSHSKHFQVVFSQPPSSGKLQRCATVCHCGVAWYLGIAPSSYGNVPPAKPGQSIKITGKTCKTAWNELTDEEGQPDTSKAPDTLKSAN